MFNKTKTVEIEDLCKYIALENILYSPSGSYLAIQSGKADMDKNDYKRDIWVIKDNNLIQLTNTNSNLLFWDDDTNILLTRKSEQSGKTDIYKQSINGGEALKYLTLPFITTKLYKVKDNLYIALGIVDANDPDAYKDNETVFKQKLEAKKEEEDYDVVDEVPYWFNGAGYINKQRTCLFVVNTKNNLSIKRITDINVSVNEVCLDQDKVYFTTSDKTQGETLVNQVYLLDIYTNKVIPVYTNNNFSINNLFILNHQLFAQVSDMKEYGLNETGNICAIEKDKVSFITDPQRSLYNSVCGDTYLGNGKQGSVTNNCFYTLATDNDHVQIWQYDINFNKSVLYDLQGAVYTIDTTTNKIAFIASYYDKLQEVYQLDLVTNTITQLTFFNQQILADKYIATPNVVEYESNRQKLKGWVLFPKGYRKDKTYPAILDVHGGPRTIYSNIFFHEMQVWASKGYIVMFTNIKGSDGRDDAFADIRGDYGYTDYKNLMDFVDTVLKLVPNIDSNKLCLTGGSYGGFMTNWIITQTDRFACAASQRSISNWISFSYLSDIGLYFGPDQNGSVDLNKPSTIQLLWNHSPLKYSSKVKTPTLFIHSDQDYRCPLPEGMQMMQSLAYNHVETRLVVFHGENHELSRSGKPKHRIRRLKEITNWFDKYTK